MLISACRVLISEHPASLRLIHGTAAELGNGNLQVLCSLAPRYLEIGRMIHGDFPWLAVVCLHGRLQLTRALQGASWFPVLVRYILPKSCKRRKNNHLLHVFFLSGSHQLFAVIRSLAGGNFYQVETFFFLSKVQEPKAFREASRLSAFGDG